MKFTKKLEQYGFTTPIDKKINEFLVKYLALQNQIQLATDNYKETIAQSAELAHTLENLKFRREKMFDEIRSLLSQKCLRGTDVESLVEENNNLRHENDDLQFTNEQLRYHNEALQTEILQLRDLVKRNGDENFDYGGQCI